MALRMYADTSTPSLAAATRTKLYKSSSKVDETVLSNLSVMRPSLSYERVEHQAVNRQAESSREKTTQCHLCEQLVLF
mgnify:CR=1 FL=1